METVIQPRPASVNGPSPHRRKLWAAFILVFILFLFVGGYVYWVLYWPNGKHIKPDFGGIGKPVFYKGEMASAGAVGTGESLKLPLPAVQKWVDPSVRFEETGNSLILTTQDKVLRMKTDQLTASVNEKPLTLRFAVEKQGDTVYVPIQPLLDLYRLKLTEASETGAVFLQKEGDAVQWGKTAVSPKHPDKTYALRKGASVKEPIYADVKQDESVIILGEEKGWYRVQLQSGYIGYMSKSDIALDRVDVVPKQEPKRDYVPWKPIGGKINLTWQQVGEKTPDMSKITAMPGLNVISPQWFYLIDGEGNMKNLADASFVKWAHSNGLQVWALFSNGFDPKRTTEALANYDTRIKMIKQVLSYAQMFHVDGINIDFENVYLKDKANMVEFVREAAPLFHEQGLVVSIDVTVKDGSETYSQFMDRKAIAPAIDYMMVMGYDEHWSTSPVAGSVSSLPWVETGITRIMKEDDVPPSKLVLGIPYYTRIWTEEQKDDKTVVTSKAVSMDTVQKLIKDKKLTPVYKEDAGQNYVEYSEDGKTMKIWIEDAVSIKARAELARKYDLAGVASWSRGFESPDIWTTLKDSFETRP